MNNTPPQSAPDALSFSTAGGSPLALENPFRGTLVIAGAGAGKTTAIAAPMIQQFARKNFAGLLYDSDSTKLAAIARQALAQAPAVKGDEKPVVLRTLNFLDLAQSEKVNPLHPLNIFTVGAAMESAYALFVHSSKDSGNFFTEAAASYLTGIIWYYRTNHPALCTIPHVVAMATQMDFKQVLNLLGNDPNCRPIVQNLITAVQHGATQQVAGIVSSLQVDLAPLTGPEISWVFNPSAAHGEGFSLNLNDPASPALLTITAHLTQARTFAPAISCLVSVATRLMNQSHKHRSYVLLDGLETLYVPGLETMTATSRSNKVALVCLTQDIAGLTNAYGQAKTEVFVSSLANQFFGRSTSPETSELLARLFQQEQQLALPAPNLLKRVVQAVAGQKARPTISDFPQLKKGEFMGKIAGTPPGVFKAALASHAEPQPEAVGAHDLSEDFRAALDANAALIRAQVAALLAPTAD